MNRILSEIKYEIPRCKCKEKISVVKKRKPNKKNRREGKALPYPDINEVKSTTFQIKYEKKLSSLARLLLNSFQKKYLYYAIDDILYLLKSNPIERDNLLTVLYSPVLSLHNNFYINFFDIWINELYINKIPKVNKFLTNDSQNFEQFNYITIKLLYKVRTPAKKQEPLW